LSSNMFANTACCGSGNPDHNSRNHRRVNLCINRRRRCDADLRLCWHSL